MSGERGDWWLQAATAALPIAVERCADQIAMPDYHEKVAYVAADIADALLAERSRRERIRIDEFARPPVRRERKR